MTNRSKLEKKLRRIQDLEEGRKQFHALVRPRVTAYVWVNNVSLPVAMTR